MPERIGDNKSISESPATPDAKNDIVIVQPDGEAVRCDTDGMWL